MSWESLLDLINQPYIRALLALAGFTLLAFVVRWVFQTVMSRLARRTATKIDDQIIADLRGPVTLSILFWGVSVALQIAPLPGQLSRYVAILINSAIIIIWSVAVLQISRLLLQTWERHSEALTRQRLLPLFENLIKLTVVLLALLTLLPLWGVPITGLLTSAGLAGLVLGLAAQSTLANIFGGVALTIDRTYKIGDYIVLDDGRRGRVSEIGLRSTRILTRDEVEITIPNALIANSKVINQTGRRSPKMRIRVPVGVAYGSDIERVRQILLEIPGDCQHTVAQPEPRVRFRALGDSSLKFELLCWIPEPSLSGRTLDELLCKIYQRFQAEGIVIPFPQRDLHLRDWPVQRGDSGA